MSLKLTILAGAVLSLACARSDQHQSRLSPELKSTVQKMIASADSIVAFDIENRIIFRDSTADETTSLNERLIGGRALDPRPGAFTVGYLARSAGRRLSESDMERLSVLLTDPRAYKDRDLLCVFEPVLALEIHHGSRISECLMEAECTRWILDWETGRTSGDFFEIRKSYHRFVAGVFHDDEHFRRLFGM